VHRSDRDAVRRIKSGVNRLESQPYAFGGPSRQPRLGGASGHAWCQLPSSVGPATGTWPNLTPTQLAGQTVYRPGSVSGTRQLIAVPGTYTLLNWRNVTWAAGKTMLVLPNGDGTWDMIDEDC